MSYYLCFQQQPWTAGYLAGWPSLLRILNFSLPLKVLFRTQIFSQLTKAKVRQLCLEDIRRLHWYYSLTFSIFEDEFVSPAMVSTRFEDGSFTDDECGEVGGDLRRLPAVFLESWDYYSLSLTLRSLRVGVQYVDDTLHGFQVSDTRLRQPNIIL